MPEKEEKEVEAVDTPPTIPVNDKGEGKPVGPATIVDSETMGDQFPLHDANL